MSRWGKNIVVPLDSLCKEKENTNRPTVARSVGTVGKWGKMGFTSTRTYTLSALHPMAAAAAAAAAAASPAQSPASTGGSGHDQHDPNDLSVSVPEPPKPKKFFKSRNAAPEVIAQIIQQLPHCGTGAGSSPMRGEQIATTPTRSSAGAATRISGGQDQTPKSKASKGGAAAHSAERKRKSPKKKMNQGGQATTNASTTLPGALGEADQEPSRLDEQQEVVTSSSSKKTKKPKEEKKLKPEAPPSRILGRARKAVNYCEVEEDERYPTPTKDLIIPKADASPDEALPPPPPPTTSSVGSSSGNAAAPLSTNAATAAAGGASGGGASTPTGMVGSSRTPEHPPIVLRISKGTSRLVSSDSDEEEDEDEHHQHHQEEDDEQRKSLDDNGDSVVKADGKVPLNTPKITVKPLRPPTEAGATEASEATSAAASGDLLDHQSKAATTAASAAAETIEDQKKKYDEAADEEEEEEEEEEDEEEPPEINYCTVKISPDKPPKERLKLIIKTDVIRNAIAKAAAAKAKAAGEDTPRSEKKSKSKKHKHLKHNLVVGGSGAVTTTITAESTQAEFKTPSPHLALSEPAAPPPLPTSVLPLRGSVISPTTRSDHDFDSQSSVLGSISSKGNSTPQPLAQAVQEDRCVIRSRGSSVITSDLETSQHSSLVAPPSDIESRLESMMDGAGGIATGTGMMADESAVPLQGDILAVLRGEIMPPKLNGVANKDIDRETGQGKEGGSTAVQEEEEQQPPKRSLRGRGKKATTTNAAPAPPVAATESRTRGRTKAAATAATTTAVTPTSTSSSPPAPATNKRSTRGRVAKKQQQQQQQQHQTTEMEIDEIPPIPTATEIEEPPPIIRGRGRRANNNNSASINNNINKIAANLSAKAEASRLNETETKGNGDTDGGGGGSGGAGNANDCPQTNLRSYGGRKRKNQQVTQVLQPEDEQQQQQQLDQQLEEEEAPPPSKILHKDNDVGGKGQEITTEADEDDEDDDDLLSNNSSMLQHDEGSSSLPAIRDYKFKDKFKRTLTLDTQVAAAAASAAASTAAAADSTAETRGSVKLVISKKKGSIFKSRALGPSDQEASAASKRHLYKHSWDAALEANGSGGTGSDASNTSAHVKGDSLLHMGGGSKSLGEADDSCSSSINNNSSTSSALRGGADSPALALSKHNSPAGTASGVGGTGTGASSAINASSSSLARQMKHQQQLAPNANAISNSMGQALGQNPFDLDLEPGGGGGGGTNSSSMANEESSSRVDRSKTKEYYTVVRNVKTAHQIQEIGEYQEMDDDVEYILDALQPHNPPPTRCLSALQLATKCMTPAFRMHVRAHGVVTKFFKALSDANKDLSLGLCTSAIMYILSQEGLNMDLDRDSLELMINLLEAEGIGAPSERANYERNKQKVRELCEEIKAQGKGTHLNVESITVGTLAMETLLSLTSKRAGEWFKEDLRKLGGLEHIIKTISHFCQPIIGGDVIGEDIEWNSSLLDNMQTVARCLRVLENVTQHNEANQRYMLTFDKGKAVNTLCQLYKLCDGQLICHPSNGSNSKEHPGVAMRELLIPVMKVLINLTHTFNESQPSLGAELLGKRSDVIETSFHLLLLASNYIPERCIFELSILVLTLLINLCMHTLPNRGILMQAQAPVDYIADNPPAGNKPVTALQALLEYFYKCEELARLVEKNTDAFLENNEKSKKKQEEVEETVNNLLQRAGHHMEHTLKGSYAAILIGNLIADNEQHEAIVRRQLRGNSFKEIVNVLEKYHTFMNLTSSLEAAFVAHMKSTKRIIDNFKKRDYIFEHSSDEHALPLNLETTTTTTISSITAATGSAGGSVGGIGVGSEKEGHISPTAASTKPRVYKTYSSHR
ncbi:uncharacterized protein Dwil_GK25084 [Drosophila willistoni]|uniref:WAPL domain-containing protein n=1 Tax=Drosophila willistoni TaxID=7260 RepID=B4NCH2_DROWI|nr:uncharacterized protein Dwil_GK25084 [Drosophila willistoni]